MRKSTNDNLKNKYLLAGLSIFCVLLILVSFLDSSATAPVKQVSGFIITPVQKGINGFGYDPIFYLPEYGMTSAEITPVEKNAISHRGKALHKMQEELKKRIQG